MTELSSAFEAAVVRSQDLSERPDNPTLLKIYALYKQASLGDNTAPRPGFTELVPRAKWDAWTRLKGTAQAAAQQQYIDLIDSLS